MKHLYVIAVLTAVLAVPSAFAKSPDELSDLEIAHVAYNAGLIDIRYAHLALSLSDNPEVRQFASLMIRDHSAVNQAAGQLLQKLNVAPKDNAVSQSLLQQASDLRKELKGLEGRAFDRRYAENELAYHEFVNNAVENVFIPNATVPELKSLLQEALQTFKVHERHARQMVYALKQAKM